MTENGEVNMKKGVLVHPQELSVRWIEQAVREGIDVLGLHPVGGPKAKDSCAALVQLLDDPEFLRLVDLAKEKGLTVEYEIHAMGWLLPRELFKTHPEYFLMDEKGERNPANNFCVCNEEAMEIVEKNAVELAKKLHGSSHRFYFWLDDTASLRCHCPKCEKLSGSDQQLLVVNRLAKALRKEFPDAQVPYLAYYGTLEPPTQVKPGEGVFLEYAPMAKYKRPDSDCYRTFVPMEQKYLVPLMEMFGRENTKVLEYWIDNSMYSNYTKPPKILNVDPEQVKKDIAYYKALGIEDITTFGCYLGQDYEELYGEPDIRCYTQAF